jgi:hypothetical protein
MNERERNDFQREQLQAELRRDHMSYDEALTAFKNYADRTADLTRDRWGLVFAGLASRTWR